MLKDFIKSRKTYLCVLMILLGAWLILVVSLCIEYYFACDVFQRSGSVLVVYAFLVAVHTYNLGSDVGKLKHYGQKIEYWKRDAPQMESEEGIKALNKILQTVTDALAKFDAGIEKSERKMMALKYTEGVIAVFGTLIWGFGDLILNIHSSGTCYL